MKKSIESQKTCTICGKPVQRIGGGKYRHCKATSDGHLPALLPYHAEGHEKHAVASKGAKKGKSLTSPRPSVTEQLKGLNANAYLDDSLGAWDAGDKVTRVINPFTILTARNTLIDHLLSRVAALEAEVSDIEQQITVLETIQEPGS